MNLTLYGGRRLCALVVWRGWAASLRPYRWRVYRNGLTLRLSMYPTINAGPLQVITGPGSPGLVGVDLNQVDDRGQGLVCKLTAAWGRW